MAALPRYGTELNPQVLHYVTPQPSFPAPSSGECFQACKTDENCTASSWSPDNECKLFPAIYKSTLKVDAWTEVKNCSNVTDMLLGNDNKNSKCKFQILFQTPVSLQIQFKMVNWKEHLRLVHLKSIFVFYHRIKLLESSRPYTYAKQM